MSGLWGKRGEFENDDLTQATRVALSHLVLYPESVAPGAFFLRRSNTTCCQSRCRVPGQSLVAPGNRKLPSAAAVTHSGSLLSLVNRLSPK